MATNSVPLSQDALAKLAKGFNGVGGASSTAYKAVVSAASRSPYMADMLNEFASRQGSKIE